MPIYEFKCNQCGKEFEHLVFSSCNAEPVACPSCGKDDTCRLMSSFSCSSSSGGSLDGGSSPSCSGHSHSKGFS